MNDIEQRLKQASPRDLRQIASEMLKGKHPELLDRKPEPAEPGPGPGDGGTTSEPPSGVNLQVEMDPRPVREEARRIARRSR